MTLELEFTGGYDAVQRNFDKLAAVVLDTGGRAASIRFSVATLSWTLGGATSAVLSVTHGLGTTPRAVLALANGTGGPDLIVCQAFSLGATTFSLQGGFRTGTAAANLTVTVGWLAIG